MVLAPPSGLATLWWCSVIQGATTTGSSPVVAARAIRSAISEPGGDPIKRVIREQRHAGRILDHGPSPRRKLLLVVPPAVGRRSVRRSWRANSIFLCFRSGSTVSSQLTAPADPGWLPAPTPVPLPGPGRIHAPSLIPRPFHERHVRGQIGLPLLGIRFLEPSSPQPGFTLLAPGRRHPPTPSPSQPHSARPPRRSSPRPGHRGEPGHRAPMQT